MELLAPAGCLETAAAAFHYGADAVYCGLHQFSARADAVNFSSEELEVLLGMARQDATRPRKVYLTLNTLLRQAELPDALQTLARLEELHPDGLIVQDLAIARLAKTYFPRLELHASTQMAIHSLDGLRACRALGFKRVIAARELTLNELVAMAAEPGIELEVFVHGALCYAYSGLCLLSSVLRDASGNRGECTYVCRNAWDISEGGKTLARSCPVMSMKDLAQPDAIGTLARAGIASVKIEGRKKTPLYVAAVTNYYRKLIDNSFREGEKDACERDIRAIFSRPWTQFFLPGSRRDHITDTAMTGPRGCPAGRVISSTPAANGRPPMLRIVTEGLTIERHDGLQVELPGRTRPYGFPVDAITLFQQGGAGRRESVFAAPPGSTIEIPLPNDAPAIPDGLAVACTSSQQTQRTYCWPSIRPALVRQRHPIDIEVALDADGLRGSAVPEGQESPRACVTLPAGERRLTPARRAPEENLAAIRDSLAKLGDTPFQAGRISVVNPGNLFAPASLLNQLRRELAAALEEQLGAARRKMLAQTAREVCEAARLSAPSLKTPRWIVKVDRPFLLNLLDRPHLERLHEVIFDISHSRPAQLQETMDALSGLVGMQKLRIALPAIFRDNDAGAGRPKEWRPFLESMAAKGCCKWQLASLGHIELLKSIGITAEIADFTADWELYCCNTQAAQMLLEMGFQRITLAPDDTLDNTCAILPALADKAEVIVQQDTPLAVSAVCVNASLNGGCPAPRQCHFQELSLTNRNGEALLAVNNHCQSVFIRKTPLDRSGDLPALLRSGARYLRADFIWRNWAPAALRDTLCTLMG